MKGSNNKRANYENKTTLIPHTQLDLSGVRFRLQKQIQSHPSDPYLTVTSKFSEESRGDTRNT